jgi:hypothetical protein
VNRKIFFVIQISLLAFSLTSCGHTEGNIGIMPTYVVPDTEADWIRNGDPVEFEGQLWYPQDSFEVLLDSEVYLVGEYKAVQLFVEKIDVRPYDRLYTKFGRNKFRIFRKERQG